MSGKCPSKPTLAQLFKKLSASIFASIIVLSLLRFLAVTGSFHIKFAELWRHNQTASPWFNFIVVTMLFISMVITQKCYAQQDKKNQIPIFRYFVFFYVLMALFDKQIEKNTYFWLFTSQKINISNLFTFLTLDFFFDPPLIFWSLTWMFSANALCKKYGKEQWLIYLCSLPFLLLIPRYSNISLILNVAAFVPSMIFYFFMNKKSPAFLMAFYAGGFNLALIFLYFYRTHEIHPRFLVATLFIFWIVWLAGYKLIKNCLNCKIQKLSSFAWLVPFLTISLLTRVLESPVLHFWYLISSLSYANIVPVPLLTIFLLTFITGFAGEKFVKPFFYLSILATATFYFADGLAIRMTGLRISYNTVAWALGYLDGFSKTAIALIDWKYVLLFSLIPVLFALMVRLMSKPKVSSDNSPFKAALVFILITSQISALMYQGLLFAYPSTFIDPSHYFLSSIPAFRFIIKDKPDLAKLIADFEECQTPLKIINSETHPQQNSAKKMNIVLIMLESINNKYLSLFGHHEPTWQELEKFKDRMEIFPCYFSNFPESSSADLSVMTGLFPPPYAFLIENTEYHAPTLPRQFKEAGYQMMLFSSGYISESGLATFYKPLGFNRFIVPQSFDKNKSDDFWAWGVKKNVMVDRILKEMQLAEKDSDAPMFVYYRTAFPHLPFKKIWSHSSRYLPETNNNEGKFVAPFKNCLMDIDEQFARLVRGIDQLKTGKNTIIVMVSDHGSMLGEPQFKGFTGHSINLHPELCNVPLVIIHPEANGLKVNPVFASHADLLPTIINLANIVPPVKTFTQGQDIRKTANNDRPIVFAAMSDQRAIIEDNHFFWYSGKDQKNVVIFNIKLDGVKTTFATTADFKTQELVDKRDKLRRIMSLQKNLLENIDIYHTFLK